MKGNELARNQINDGLDPFKLINQMTKEEQQKQQDDELL
jgi:hypothetical protein